MCVRPAAVEVGESERTSIAGQEDYSSSKHHGDSGTSASSSSIGSSLRDYFDVLVKDKSYKWIFLASVLQQLGGWANLIASIKVVVEHGGSGVSTSLIFFLRNIPAVLFAPFAGYAADKMNRKHVLIGSCLVSAATAASFVFLTLTSNNLGLLYMLVFFKNASGAFYNPSKRAIIPMIIPKEKLHIAMTLDGIAWSSMLAIGAALGGIMTSQLGLVKCFLLDSLGFLLSASCLLLLPKNLKASDHEELLKATSGKEEATDSRGETRGGLEACSDDMPRTLLSRALDFVSESSLIFREPSLRIPLLYATMKASGGFIWGPADVLNMKWSEKENLQLVKGDQPLNLGLSYAFVGLGCLVGPVCANRFYGKERNELISAIVFGMCLLLIGYICWAFAANFFTVQAGNVFRAAASAAIWIKSTILIQLHCDQKFLGRLFATEMAFYTIASSTSMFSSGLLLDHGIFSEWQISQLLVAVSIVVSLLWLYIKIALRKQETETSSSQVLYERVNSTDDL